MKTKLSIGLLFIMPLFILSCIQDIKISKPQKNVLIFCDLTTSLSFNDIKSQSNKVKQLIDSLPFNSLISVYPMDVSIYQDPLFQYPIKPLNEKHKSKNIETKKIKIKIADSIKNILIDTYSKHSKKGNKSDFKSCIISSFEMAYNLLPNDKELLKNTQVIFFSDMIEQCPESIVGGLYMCSKNKKPSFKRILKQISDKYNPTFKLSDKLRKDQIHVVITSSYGNQKMCITEGQQNQVWDKIFMKQGFENPQDIYRKSIIPDLW